ncbi:hypothetical protein BY996DRAFT_6415199 [Phakopsora pachyrhizi]|uniref:Expressed protein n=1 Tax=Phakopsora pachyrhizi TaxID=170000 RepID=A0AAV0BQG4_PHAPC|nr:hypothetical protein BY996DRAFT_6417500 [Phakopsora pachyrhizi]KAI8452788.1 hypothetical protein BY996DRAFT_6415199 [Phakopsora pachyrhizi]CAH7689614.1 expressed protein [Phakopsora pachyrhizi]
MNQDTSDFKKYQLIYNVEEDLANQNEAQLEQMGKRKLRSEELEELENEELGKQAEDQITISYEDYLKLSSSSVPSLKQLKAKRRKTSSRGVSDKERISEILRNEESNCHAESGEGPWVFEEILKISDKLKYEILRKSSSPSRGSDELYTLDYFDGIGSSDENDENDEDDGLNSVKVLNFIETFDGFAQGFRPNLTGLSSNDEDFILYNNTSDSKHETSNKKHFDRSKDENGKITKDEVKEAQNQLKDKCSSLNSEFDVFSVVDESFY